VNSKTKFVNAHIAILFALTTIAGCAYRFSAHDRRLPGGYDRIAVPMFKNFTQETAVETFFTSAMIEEFQRDQFTKVVTKEDAQVILEAEIKEIQYTQGALVEHKLKDPKDRTVYLVSDYRIYVTVDMRLKRASDQKLLWQGSFQGEKQYPAPQVTTEGLDTANPNYNHSVQLQNIKILAKDVMTQAYTNLTENF
jgi:hypothetical protein